MSDPKQIIEALQEKRAKLVRKRKSLGSIKAIRDIEQEIRDVDKLIKFWRKNG